MKKSRKLRGAVLGGFAIFLSGIPFISYAETEQLSQQEFYEFCEEHQAEKVRSPYPPSKDREVDLFNYGFHYRDVLLSSDGRSFVDNPHDTASYSNLAAGQVIMDMEDGYEISYEYHMTSVFAEESSEYVVEGDTITPYYRAVPSESESGVEYRYINNHPEKPPVIPDFPKDYDWKKHKETTLQVIPKVTLRSEKDGVSHVYCSRISYITNLYKKEPDCYTLRPTDLEAYTVQKGDSLYKIAAKYYGSGEEWRFILERNQDYIPNADRIQPGLLLVIPNADAYR